MLSLRFKNPSGMSKWFALWLLSLLSINLYSQDLIVTAYTGPKTFSRYQKFAQNFTIKNVGIVPTGEFECRVIFSSDTIIDSSDKFVGNRYLSDLGANTASEELFTGECDVVPGTYFMIVELDQNDNIAETDEENNIYIVDNITVTPADVDWQFSSLSLDSSQWFAFSGNDTVFHQSEFVYPIFQVTNSGTTDVEGIILTQFYLSTDNVLDAGDKYFGSVGNYLSGPDQITGGYPWGFNDYIIPADLTPGKYYLIGKTDSGIDYDETDESNNTFASAQIVIGKSDIDLSISDLDGAGFSGYYLNASYRLLNTGKTGAGGYFLDAYLSSDANLDSNDFYFGSSFEAEETPYISENSYASGYFMRYLGWTPDPLAPGNYFLILVVNGQHDVRETDYSNNQFVSPSPMVVVAPPPQPAISIIGGKSNDIYDNTDTHLSFDITMTNSGDLSNAQDFGVEIKNSIGTAVYSNMQYQFMALSSGDTTTYTWNLDLSAPLPYGTYHVEISSGPSWSLTPSYTFDFNVDIPTYAVTGTIQGEDGVAINHGKIFLYQKHDNGKVSFINKTLFTSDNHFSFMTDYHKHTLFYIPNPVTYPDYVPTIFRKTVTLKESNFFTLTQNMDTVFEILKAVPIGFGSKSISGNVHTDSAPHAGRILKGGAAQRIEQLQEETEGFPVVLLSSSGEPVKVTTTDADGNYEFTALPDDTYAMVVALELDQPLMQEPLVVNVTHGNAVVDFGIGATVVQPETFFQQQITFRQFGAKSFGDAAFTPDIFAPSQLPVSLTSSDLTVARIENGKIVIIGAGKTIITAYQAGEGSYLEASPVQQQLIVTKAIQTINVDELPARTFGDAAFDLNASSSAGLPLILTSSNRAVATISNGKIEIKGAGTTVITATQGGDNNYAPALFVERTFVVNKLPQMLKVSEITEKTFGTPAFALEIETNSDSPVIVRSSDNNVANFFNNKIHIRGTGTADIIVKTNGGQNYETVSVTRKLVVRKGDQAITFAELPEVSTEDPAFTLKAIASSFLHVSFSSDNEAVATVSADRVTIKGSGTANITATQSGSGNYNAAQSVSRALKVGVVAGIEQSLEEQLKAFPNPVTDFITFECVDVVRNVFINDACGNSVNNFSWSQNSADLRTLAAGIYVIRIQTVKKQHLIKVMKK
jgi:hypothetical protein